MEPPFNSRARLPDLIAGLDDSKLTRITELPPPDMYSRRCLSALWQPRHHAGPELRER